MRTVSLEEAAEHEAGHYVIARVVGIDLIPILLTVAGGNDSGGVFLYKRPAESQPDLEKEVVFSLAGVAAQSLGNALRCGGGMPAERIGAEIVNCFQCGHYDLMQLCGAFPEYDPSSRVVDDVGGTLSLVFDWWDEISLLAEELVWRRTLYGCEPDLLFHDSRILYYRTRLRVEPDTEWKCQMQAAGVSDWFQPYSDWFAWYTANLGRFEDGLCQFPVWQRSLQFYRQVKKLSREAPGGASSG